MTHELAQELKEAGFPQNKTGRFVYAEGVVYSCDQYKCACPRCYGDDNDEGAYLPTLSELIEACGEDFWMLEKTEAEEAQIAQQALGIATHYRAMGTHKDRGRRDMALIPNYYGTTPEEAVARLWLALKKYEKENKV